GGAGERQVLDVGAQRVADRVDHLVRTGVGRFGHLVAGVVDKIEVVAEAAAHDVGAEPTVQRVVACAAGDGVIARAAGDGGVAAGGALERDGIGPGEIGEAGRKAVVDHDRLDVYDASGGQRHVAGDLERVGAAAAVDEGRSDGHLDEIVAAAAE